MTQQGRELNIDLHRHLDGNIRISTILSLAQKHQISLPSDNVTALEKYIYVQDKSPDLLSFLEKLDFGVKVLAKVEDCRRIAYENVVDAISEGLDYVELRFSPYYMSLQHNLSLEAVVEAVVDGVKSANREYQYNAKLIGILSRTFGVKACHDELNALLTQSDHIVALDLAGDEKGYPASLFIEHFKKAREVGWRITVHAGESDGPSSIKHAINLLGADRIGHGVAAHSDQDLMQYLAEQQIGLEICLLSNYQTGTWPDIASHPLPTFLKAGMLVCLNTDDPGISNNTLSSEYKLAKDELKLSDEDIATLKHNSLEMAFLSKDEKQQLSTKSSSN